MRGSSSPVVAVASAVFVAVVSAFVPTIAQAQPPIPILDQQVTLVFDSPCLPGEVITVEARVLTTIYARADQAGGVHATLRFVTKGKGVSSSTPFQPAKEYVLNSESVEETNMTSNGTTETTFVINHLLVRKSEVDATADTPIGSGDDFMWKELAHVTINKNTGLPTVTFARERARCM